MTAAADLLSWYDRAHRDLPWRRSRDPWAIWVSEVMLQQTRVETVVPYFDRFLARFPTPAALAAAPLAEALAVWSGLGYYRRCRQLHQAASRIAAAGGGIPSDKEALRRLPGVGDYTAAAVASIAFGERVPVLDGNVARLAGRLLALAEPASRAAVRRRLAAFAADLLDPVRPGDSNQALMELGATVCLPREPRCGSCPLSSRCLAAASGDPARFPPQRDRPATRRALQVAALVENGGRLLLVRRGEGEAQLAGLWELPTADAPLVEATEELARRHGGRWSFGVERARARHSITVRRLEIVAVDAEWRGAATLAEGEAGWFDPAAAAALPLTGATRKLLAKMARAGPKRQGAD